MPQQVKKNKEWQRARNRVPYRTILASPGKPWHECCVLVSLGTLGIWNVYCACSVLRGRGRQRIEMQKLWIAYVTFIYVYFFGHTARRREKVALSYTTGLRSVFCAVIDPVSESAARPSSLSVKLGREEIGSGTASTTSTEQLYQHEHPLYFMEH
ncbi:hypothetical protein GQ43DRAFT_429599 [Delitschia confertaspora ATCC 74209]|uniref:Uncharacterized protein n=1 Tax=Delitschia confertaspora ATCC 74209 TaxID=1513339 RepID=A0A9P4JV19_9PLEO|nr:hypothetical protein GQ43DRAFT_429599 [Delitschia confertaspora ATCC 74209]